MLRIVIPTFNRVERLVNLVDFILSHDIKLQLVIVDDHSNESNIRRLFDLKENYINDKRLSIIFNNINTGGAGARVIGANYDGDYNYIWFFDDDDFINSDGFSKFVLYLDSCLDDFIVLPSQYGECVNEPIIDNFYQRLRRHGQNFNTSSCIFSKKLYFKSGGWDTDLVSGQDTDLFLRVAKICSPIYYDKLKVIILEHEYERITTNWKKQMKGKFQFLRKHYRTLHPFRAVRYLLTFLLFIPLLKLIWKKY
ncbi:glycosyltransferase [Vibrio lentus]|uniref:glycosyltransferase n=1 Tax=Vibrio lentus TaxID=136468 RepID=UPI000C828907|nr:glycosyltransferase family 2 protein [Vibrio lentus]PMI86552.1 hypothetical protein BCU35_14730 [Vibrio lentus]